jgi:hypothetical protein
MFLTEEDRAIYEQCRGRCGLCLWQGGCDLEDKLDEEDRD